MAAERFVNKATEIVDRFRDDLAEYLEGRFNFYAEERENEVVTVDFSHHLDPTDEYPCIILRVYSGEAL